MGQKRAHRALLKLSRSAVEAVFDGVPVLALIVDLKRRTQRLEQSARVVDAPAWKCDMLGKVLCTVDDARDTRRGEPHALLLVEVGILEAATRLSALMSDGGSPALLMNSRCAKVASMRVGTGSLTVGTTGVARRDGGRSQGVTASSSSSPLVRTPSICPVRRASDATRSTVEAAMRRALARYAHCSGKGLNSSSTNTVLSLARGPCCSGNAIRLPKTAAGHGVLVRKQPVIGGHVQTMASRHRLGNQEAAHLAGDRCRDRRIEEEPSVRPIARARTLDRNGQSRGIAGATERGDILLPVRLVEIRREEPARLIAKQGIDAGDMASPQMVQYHTVVHRQERLIRTLSAAHSRLLADSARPFITARRGIPCASGLATGPLHREHINAASKQGPEQGHFFDSRHRNRIPGTR